MAITLRQSPHAKVIELGGGSNPTVRPNVDVRHCFDAQGNPTVDFTADFNEPLPIQSEEWDGVLCQYVIEHLSWRKLKGFLAEVFRILKPGGKGVFVTANTEAQFQWIKDHPDGWDGQGPFESFSCVIFGDQDYPENSHRNYLNPRLLSTLLAEVGFANLIVQPYGERDTDMVVEAVRPVSALPSVPRRETFTPLSEVGEDSFRPSVQEGNPVQTSVPETVKVLPDHPHKVYDKAYFNGGGKYGGYAREGYWDFPCHEQTTRKILEYEPKSVLELGAARGYVLKKLQDAGVENALGIEVSRHCWLTRVCDDLINQSLTDPWQIQPGTSYDLCYSVSVLEHIPEKDLPALFAQMAKHSRRGVHGIDFGDGDDGFDKTHVSLHPQAWWLERLPDGHVAVSNKVLEAGELPADYLADPAGRVKLNLGSFTTMFHRGWMNIDIHDLKAWAQTYKYNYLQHDLRNGIPYQTGAVDLLYCSHMLEHLSFDDGKKFLQECRRVLKRGGVLRIAVPDALKLMGQYLSATVPDAEHNYTFKVAAQDFWQDCSEINDGVAAAKTYAEKLHHLLYSGHDAIYDKESLSQVLSDCGFTVHPGSFCHSQSQQMLHETVDMFPTLSLYVDAVPAFAS